MSLTTLAGTLIAQANAGSTIILDDSVLGADAVSALRTAFALGASENLTIVGVRGANVVGPSNGTLTINAGTVSLFKKTALAITVEFTEPGDATEALIYVTMGSAWTFHESFPSLDNFPFNLIDFSGPGIAVPQFVYTTAVRNVFQWPGYTNAQPITLSPGLWFFSQIGLGSLPILGELLGTLLPSAPVDFYGPFAAVAGQSLPVGTITASLSAGTFTIGSAPNTLALSAPAIAFRITPAVPPLVLQRLQLLITSEFNQVLDISIAIPAGGTPFTLSAGPPQDKSTPIQALIESLPGGSDFSQYIPAELDTIFATIGLASFSMVTDTTPSVQSIGFAVTTQEPWTLIPDDVLVLDNLSLKVSIIEALTPTLVQAWISATATFLPKIFPGDFDFTVGLHGPPYTIASVSGNYAGFVALPDLINEVMGETNDLPSALAGISFSDFGVTATRTAVGTPWNYSFSGSAETSFPVLGTALSALLYVNVTHTPATKSAAVGNGIQLAGGLVIGEQSFALTLDMASADAKLSASWANGAEPLGFDT